MTSLPLSLGSQEILINMLIISLLCGISMNQKRKYSDVRASSGLLPSKNREKILLHLVLSIYLYRFKGICKRCRVRVDLLLKRKIQTLQIVVNGRWHEIIRIKTLNLKRGIWGEAGKVAL